MASSMTEARRSIVAAIYYSLIGENPSPSGSDALESWLQIARSVRGPLERKRAADRNKLAKFLRTTPEDIDVEKFVFATEVYLTVRAEMLVDLALQIAREVEIKPLTAEIVSNLVNHAVEYDSGSFLNVAWLQDIFRSLPENVIKAEQISAVDTAKTVIRGPLFDALQLDHRELIPKELRHMTGVYYTPQQLAQYVIRRAKYDSSRSDLSALTMIDPACGSGVFLVAAAEELRIAVENGSLDQEKAREILLSNVMGCDVDRLAITQATANMRLALIALGDHSDDVRILRPTYLKCRDSLQYDGAMPPADVVVGNPPWVNWEYLPPAYRAKHQDLWPELGIFDLKGRDRAFSKEDVSALFMAVAVDQYARDGATVSFIVPQSLVKSALNHRAFRKFALRNQTIAYKVNEVEDMVAIRPFEGVSNRTIIIHAQRGLTTTYPVRYRRWVRLNDNSFDPTGAQIIDEFGEPSNSTDRTSHWTTGLAPTLEALRGVEGSSQYRARTGLFTGGANAVYHLEVLSTEGRTAHVRNITERAKRAVPAVEAELEFDHVYPFLRGRDVGQWRYESEIFTLLPHTAASKMDPIDEGTLLQRTPLTYAYFDQFRDVLALRGGFVGWERKALDVGFYACQRVGEYTFSPWKVVWRYIAPRFTCAVIAPYQAGGPFRNKPIIPNEKLMTIDCGSPEEAYYLCGLLSTSCAVSFVHSRMVSTQIAPHLIQGLNIPRFEPSDTKHKNIAELCMSGHELVRQTAPVPLVLLDELDDIGANVLGAPRDGARLLRQQLIDAGFTYGV